MKTIHGDKATVAILAGQTLTRVLTSFDNKVPILLMVSGGSAFSLLEYVSKNILNSLMTVCMLDDRFSTDSTVNNFTQLTETSFYALAGAAGATFISTQVLPPESLGAYADRFESELQKWRKDNPTGVVVATLGMGIDGHTAGIFPGCVETLDSRKRFVEGYELPAEVSLYQERLTVTPHFLTTQISAAVAYVTGAEKSAILKNIIAPGRGVEYPAMLWKRIPQIEVVTDCLLSEGKSL